MKKVLYLIAVSLFFLSTTTVGSAVAAPDGPVNLGIFEYIGEGAHGRLGVYLKFVDSKGKGYKAYKSIIDRLAKDDPDALNYDELTEVLKDGKCYEITGKKDSGGALGEMIVKIIEVDPVKCPQKTGNSTYSGDCGDDYHEALLGL